MAVTILTPKSTRKFVIAPINPVSIPTIELILLINLFIPSKICGRLLTNHPINIIPKKSKILPRNPLVLADVILPVLLAIP